MNGLAQTSQAAPLQTKEECIAHAAAGIELIQQGELMLREAVVSWVQHGWELRELAEAIGKALGYVRNVVTRCRQLGLLPEQTYHTSKISPTGEIPVENPQALSAFLPTKRHVEAFSQASDLVKAKIVSMSNQPEQSQISVRAIRLMDEDECIDPSKASKEEIAGLATDLFHGYQSAKELQKLAEAEADHWMSRLGTIDSQGSFTPFEPLELVKRTLPCLNKSELLELQNLLSKQLMQSTEVIDV